jgi:transcriptional regulator with GAF, ATPase, and Fis domain
MSRSIASLNRHPFSSIGMRYTVAIVSSGAAFVVAFLFQQIHVRDPFALLFLAAIWVSIWYGGDGPGVVGIVLSALGLTAFLRSSNGWLRIASYDFPTYCVFFLFIMLIWRFGRNRRRTELLLEQSRDQLEEEVQSRTTELMRMNAEKETILDGAPFGIALLGPDRMVRHCNRGYESMLRFDRGELDGTRAPLPEREEPIWKAQEEQLRAGQRIIDYQGPRIRKDRSEFSASIFATPLFDDLGQYIGAVGVIIDNTEQLMQEAERQRLTTERKQIEEELRRRDAYLTEGQKISHTGSWAWNATTNEGFCSQEILCILGLDEKNEQLDLSAFCGCVHRDDVEKLKILWQSAVEQRIEIDHKHRILRPDGSIRYVRLLGRPFPLENGENELIGTVMDVTEQHEDRKALQESLRDNEVLLAQNQALQEKLRRENISLQELNLALQDELADIQRNKFEKIIGGSPALQRTLNKVEQVAATDATVLITGETGTGKELIAQAIHENSKRARMPFRSINCAALPATLMAAELFGHEKGAFTGADRQRVGQFELAAGGTLFLDEIAEIPIDMQAALLRVLEERSFERLGGTKLIPADVRVIAATNRDLHAAMRVGDFRQDLFYRLNAFPIEVPPLRERRDDIAMLVNHFIRLSAVRHGKTIRNLEKRGMELLRSYDWPGNIRELRNVIDTSVITANGEGIVIDEELLFATRPPDDAPIGSLQKEMESHERMLIERTLAETQGRVYGPSGAGAILHIPPTTLSAKIKTLKIDTAKFRPRSS